MSVQGETRKGLDMKARAFLIVPIVALLASLAPSLAYAYDLDDELDGAYDGNFWTNYVSEDNNIQADPSSQGGVLSVQLILSDIYQYNADLLMRGQSPAAQLGIQLTQLDFIRGAYYKLKQIKDYVGNSDSKLLDIRSHTHDIKSSVSGILTYMIDNNDLIEDIKSYAQAMDGNLDLLVESINTFGVIQQGISDKISNVYTRQQSIMTRLGTIEGKITTLNTTLTNFRNENHSDLQAISSAAGTTNDYLSGFGDYLENLPLINDDLDSVLSALSDIASNQQDIISALQNPTSSVDLTGVLNRLDYIVRAFQSVDTINGYLSYRGMIRDMFQSYNNINGMSSFRAYIRSIFAGTENVNGRTSLYAHINSISNNLASLRNEFNAAFSDLFDYLTNIDGLLKQVRDLLSVSNPDELVGDFDDLEFDTNVDDLVSRLATVAPFGALLMVSAELDILHSVSEIQTPSFVFPFDFFGSETVTIDLSFLADARPLFNFVVVFGFVYMLLIYSIDFIKEGEL